MYLGIADQIAADEKDERTASEQTVVLRRKASVVAAQHNTA